MTDHTPDVLDVFDAVTVAAEAANGTSCPLWEDAFLDALTAAGFVVVRDRSGALSHGDELTTRSGYWRRVERPEPVADDACGFCSGGPAGPNPDCPHHAPEDVK